jgi:hypothetical protein
VIKVGNERTIQMATQYMYNSMGVGRRGRLTKGEMDENNMIYVQTAFKIVGKTQSKDRSSTAWEQEQTNHYFHFQAHNIDLWTNNKVYKHTYFWSFGICSVAPTLLDVLWL